MTDVSSSLAQPGGLPAPAADRALPGRANLALALKLAAAGVGYLFMILLARAMSLEGFGTVAFFLNLALLMSVLGSFGQQMALLRFVPPLAAAGDLGQIRLLLRRAALRAGSGTLIVSALLLVLFMSGTPAARGVPGGISLRDMLLGLALVPLTGWLELQAHLARGFHLLALALAPREILWRIGVGAAVATAWFMQGGTPVSSGIVLALLAGGLIVAGAAQARILWRRTGLGATAVPAPDPQVERDWRTHERAFWVSSVSNMFLANASVIVVGLSAGAGAAALFFAANRLAMVLGFVMISNNLALAPMLSQAWKDGRREPLRRLALRATWRAFVPTAALGVALAVGAPSVLSLFGPEFPDASGMLRLLILAILLDAGGGASDILLNMCGRQRAAMRASLASLLAAAVLLTGGTALGGAFGCALAVVVASGLRKALFWWVCLRQLGIRTDILAARDLRREPRSAGAA